jgi:hypothetical protein
MREGGSKRFNGEKWQKGQQKGVKIYFNRA